VTRAQQPAPFVADRDVTLYQGDALETLRALPDGCVDVVVTDPPYGETSLSWDVPAEDWLALVDRLLKPTGSMWVFGSMRFLAPMVAACDARQLGPWRFSHEVVWEKHNGSGFQSGRFRRVHEFAAHFYRGPWESVYRKQVVTMDATARVVRSKRRPTHTGHIDRTPYVSEDGGPRQMTTVIYCRSEHGRAIHPTQKPLGIIRPLLEYSCPQGGTVLDPFAGSASVGVAAQQTGRKAILVEKDEVYCRLAADRLSQLSLLAEASA